MELKDFVKRALVEVVQAIREAGSEIGTEDGALVAPILNHVPSGAAFPVFSDQGGGLAYPIEFDLSVTVSEGLEAKHGASGKLTIASVLTAGGSMSEANTEAKTAVQRIKFMVPVRYPNGHRAPHKRAESAEANPVSWKTA